jgi:hypothetical protein
MNIIIADTQKTPCIKRLTEYISSKIEEGSDGSGKISGGCIDSVMKVLLEIDSKLKPFRDEEFKKYLEEASKLQQSSAYATYSDASCLEFTPKEVPVFEWAKEGLRMSLSVDQWRSQSSKKIERRGKIYDMQKVLEGEGEEYTKWMDNIRCNILTLSTGAETKQYVKEDVTRAIAEIMDQISGQETVLFTDTFQTIKTIINKDEAIGFVREETIAETVKLMQGLNKEIEKAEKLGIGKGMIASMSRSSLQDLIVAEGEGVNALLTGGVGALGKHVEEKRKAEEIKKKQQEERKKMEEEMIKKGEERKKKEEEMMEKQKRETEKLEEETRKKEEEMIKKIRQDLEIEQKRKKLEIEKQLAEERLKLFETEKPEEKTVSTSNSNTEIEKEKKAKEKAEKEAKDNAIKIAEEARRKRNRY